MWPGDVHERLARNLGEKLYSVENYLWSSKDISYCAIFTLVILVTKKENAFIEFADDNLGGTASVLKDRIKI